MILFGILSIVIHSIFLYSVFDIYFKSPLIHGMTPHSVPLPAPAKRLVLFVADGMRADKFFEVGDSGSTNSPFLRDIITNVGVWGVSHTRVPTESRPGHVALAAGIYEDVSAVTKGWKENPVEFDSVFNESRYTFAWGSPDILPMFSKGAKNNVFIDTYTSMEEDFAGATPHNLDTWVFQKLEKFLEDARLNATLKNLLLQDEVIFFLHLLGMDMSGHSYKPGSQEYVKNIQVVDSGVEKCMNLIEDFYNRDGKTAYVFTSDHGMTDWGSHGSGEMHETYTPIVAWGAGIRGPLGEGKDMYHDGLSTEWRLAHVKRVDINQVDIAPLISALIGIPFPVNSHGILPVEFLGTEWTHKAIALLTNARQILANYQSQMLEKRENTIPMFFWQFKDLSSSRQAELMSMVEVLLKQNRYKDVIQVGLKIIELALKGLTYYQKHDRIALSISIFLGFLGWMAYLFVLILKDYTTVGQTSLESFVKPMEESFPKIKCGITFVFVGSIIALLLYVQNAPVMYYAYFLMPVLLWMIVCLHWDLICSAKLHLKRTKILQKFIGITFLSFIGMEFLVISFFRREVMSFVLWAMSCWPCYSLLLYKHQMLCLSWFIVSIVLSIFPMMSVVGKDTDYNLVILAGWLFVFAVGFSARRPETGLIFNNRSAKKEPYHIVVLTAVQVLLLCISTYTIKSTSMSIANKEGLPILNQIVSWFVLGFSLILPLFGSQALLTRLLNVMTSLFAPYLLLSISHEGIFLFLLCIEMLLWLFMEHHLSESITRRVYPYKNWSGLEGNADLEVEMNVTYTTVKDTQLQDIYFVPEDLYTIIKKRTNEINLGDLRRAYFFIFFILLSFFGTGNIASINSFNPTSVYCFLTVFHPFIMGFLILIKVVIPFLIVSCVFRALNVCLKVSPRALFLVILLMSDFLALHFFFMVKDTGSWLDIGTSLSHFIISITITIFIMLLYGLAWMLTSFNLTLPSFKNKRHLL